MGRAKLKAIIGIHSDPATEALAKIAGRLRAAVWDVRLDDLTRAYADIWTRRCVREGVARCPYPVNGITSASACIAAGQCGCDSNIIPAPVERPCDTEAA